MSDHKPLPIHGYVPQSDVNVQHVNLNKQIEERVLQTLDELAKMENVDKRWLAIGRTHIEQGFMAINRSIFKPTRTQLT